MRRSKPLQKSPPPTRSTQPLLLSPDLIHTHCTFHWHIFSTELTLLENPFFSRTVKVSIEFWSGCRLSKLVPFLASLRWCRVLSQSPDCSRRKQFSSSSIITLSWNLWRKDLWLDTGIARQPPVPSFSFDPKMRKMQKRGGVEVLC